MCWKDISFPPGHLWELQYFQEKAILTPRNEIVEMVNDHVLYIIPEE